MTFVVNSQLGIWRWLSVITDSTGKILNSVSLNNVHVRLEYRAARNFRGVKFSQMERFGGFNFRGWASTAPTTPTWPRLCSTLAHLEFQFWGELRVLASFPASSGLFFLKQGLELWIGCCYRWWWHFLVERTTGVR